ncbi:MAG TPA: pyridoxal-dependent decarboxylase [Candidatus Acidoferrales bacterium]|nr:pyridoxal-dependent decarboxylase [Candidatus Acidoferrales bacterium]
MPNMNFSLTPKQRRRLWEETAKLASAYWDHAADEATPVLSRRGRRRRQSLPERGRPPERVLREVVNYISRNACHLSSPRYYGLMNPKPTLAGVLGDALASVVNQQLAVEAHAPGATALEEETLGWFLAALGWRRGLGQFASGGSEANLIALKVALNHRLPEIARRGVRGLRGQPVFYVSEESHHSLEKFADLLSLGREAVRWIPTDRELALRPELLAAQIRKDRRAGRLPFCVVATFGTTSSGAADPIARLARLCRRERLWLHVDGAYGGSLILAPRFRRLWGAIRQADSLTFDPHKWMAMPFPLGAVLVRDRQAAAAPFRVQAAYVPRGARRVENYQLGVQWSRRFLGLKLWLTLQVHGRRAYEAHFAEQIRLAGFFRQRLAARPRFGTVSESPLPITCFTYCEETRGQRRKIPLEELTPFEQQMNLLLAEEIVRRGWAWISSTRLRGVMVMRMMVINYDTRERHLRRLVADLERLAGEPGLRRRARRQAI